ncbi:hypothetical protein TNCT_397951 [Trichonephila clavata]|uniref:Uncharacterized protein n=1 Tax=Trichonephila clavata TaxID=2740835 RepID=A0A8X6H7U8_TRICU|nr:hypothetical protein TNCT_397951 [Trichonephila clavata]
MERILQRFCRLHRKGNFLHRLVFNVRNPPSFVSSDSSSSPPRLTGGILFSPLYSGLCYLLQEDKIRISPLQHRINDTPAAPSPERIFSHCLLRLEDPTLPHWTPTENNRVCERNCLC